jgi:peptidoglycan/LPS O-acetylase OafA/YrhL
VPCTSASVGEFLVWTFLVSFALALMLSTLLFLVVEKPYFYWHHGRKNRRSSGTIVAARAQTQAS